MTPRVPVQFNAYLVGGDASTDHRSLLLRSWYDLADGTACEDVVAGCG